MLVVILLYDQLIFRPLIAWVDRLRFEQDPSGRVPRSWALTMMQRSRLISALTGAFYAAVRWTSWAMSICPGQKLMKDRSCNCGKWLLKSPITFLMTPGLL